MTSNERSNENPGRRYDKGERRFKHVGKGPEPKIQFLSDEPKRWEGKCPNGLSSGDHVRLLNEAIPGNKGDRDIDFPKNLYVVHDGAVYEAATTDRGKSYHGYPYRGKLPKRLIDELREMAVEKACEKQFDDWIKRHISTHGS
jgi:hypothetical protein